MHACMKQQRSAEKAGKEDVNGALLQNLQTRELARRHLLPSVPIRFQGRIAWHCTPSGSLVDPLFLSFFFLWLPAAGRCGLVLVHMHEGAG